MKRRRRCRHCLHSSPGPISSRSSTSRIPCSAITQNPEELARQGQKALKEEVLHNFGSGHLGSIPHGLPGAGGRQQRAGPGGSYSQVLERFLLDLGQGFLLHRPTEAHDHQREGLLSGSGRHICGFHDFRAGNLPLDQRYYGYVLVGYADVVLVAYIPCHSTES